MKQTLPEEAQDRDPQRAVILALTGFSFTAVSALAILESAARPGLQMAMWFVFCSFVAFLSALNLQAYKAYRWENQIATTCAETGTFSLLISVLALIFSTKYSVEFKYACATLGLFAWSADFFTTLRIEHLYYSALESATEKKLEKT